MADDAKVRLEWEQMEQFELGHHGLAEHEGLCMWRAKVPGGWLVKSEFMFRGGEGSLAFVPDPNHTWG